MTCFFVSQKRDFREETDSVLSTVRGLLDDHAQPGGNADTSLQVRYTHTFTDTLNLSVRLPTTLDVSLRKVAGSQCTAVLVPICILMCLHTRTELISGWRDISVYNIYESWNYVTWSLSSSPSTCCSFSIYHCLSAFSLLPTHYLSSLEISHLYNSSTGPIQAVLFSTCVVPWTQPTPLLPHSNFLYLSVSLSLFPPPPALLPLCIH